MAVSSENEIVNAQAENVQLRAENRLLKQRLQKIEERLLNLETSLPKEKVVVLRRISKRRAKKEIQDLFAEGKTLYYSDIAERLGLDLQLVVEICDELEAEGVIA